MESISLLEPISSTLPALYPGAGSLSPNAGETETWLDWLAELLAGLGRLIRSRKRFTMPFFLVFFAVVDESWSAMEMRVWKRPRCEAASRLDCQWSRVLYHREKANELELTDSVDVQVKQTDGPQNSFLLHCAVDYWSWPWQFNFLSKRQGLILKLYMILLGNMLRNDTQTDKWPRPCTIATSLSRLAV